MEVVGKDVAVVGEDEVAEEEGNVEVREDGKTLIAPSVTVI